MLDCIVSLGPNTTNGSGFRVLSSTLHEHVDATKVGAYCAVTEVSYSTEKLSTDL
jgi:hypothetical protein